MGGGALLIKGLLSLFCLPKSFCIVAVMKGNCFCRLKKHSLLHFKALWMFSLKQVSPSLCNKLSSEARIVTHQCPVLHSKLEKTPKFKRWENYTLSTARLGAAVVPLGSALLRPTSGEV